MRQKWRFYGLSDKTRGKITRDLSKIDTRTQGKSTPKNDEEPSTKQYAVTKKEAALQKHCAVKDIEQGIQDGLIRTYGNNTEKVLVSSLKNFVPPKKRLKMVNG